MGSIIKRVSDVLGVLGIIVCLVAGVTRSTGAFQFMGSDTISLFQGGTGLMVAACLLKLWAMERAAVS